MTPTGGGTASDATAGPARSLIRAEERLNISTTREPARRVRLEKYVVTETRTVTVQVRREEVRLIDINADINADIPSDTETGGKAEEDSGRWLTLHEERVVVGTEVVPVERVRLSVDTVVEYRDVTAELRQERIDFEPAVTPADTDTTNR